MFNAIVGAGPGAVGAGAGAASRYGSGSDQKMQLLAAPAPQHCFLLSVIVIPGHPVVDIQYRPSVKGLILFFGRVKT
jgi:hypothetical protein